jgi:L-phenylalanine/L-methionine N-acetyltransferase
MLRLATSNDFYFIKSLYFHKEINPFLLYEMAEESHFMPIFQDLLDKNVLFVFENENEQVGMLKLQPMTFRARHIAYLGGVAIAPEHSGKGLAQKMFLEMTEYAKTQSILRIELSTATENHRAIALYEKIGFQKEGVLRKYTHLKSENIYLDEAMYAILL